MAPDIASITAALGSIKAAADLAKLIKDSGASLEQAEIKLKIAELIGSLADAKIELATIQGALLEKDHKIEELTQLINVKATVQWEKPYYWVVNGDEKDGPFCQKCYDTGNQLVRLQGGGTRAWRCHACDGAFTDANYVQPKVTRRITGF